MIPSLYNRLLEWRRYQKLDQLDWISRNTLIVKKALPGLKKKAINLPPPSNPKKILIWAITAWERGALEDMVALCLQLRGHDVRGVMCGGGMEACSMESTIYKRPDCEYCQNRALSFKKMFDVDMLYKKTTDYLSNKTISSLKTQIDALEPKEFINFIHREIATGKLTERDLPQYYFKLCNIEDSKIEPRVRSTLLSTTLYTEAALNCIDIEKPDIVITSSGKTIGFGPMYETCKSKNIPIITWDEVMGGKNSFLFCVNNFANEYHLNQQWDIVKKEPWTTEKKNFVSHYFKNTRKGDFGRVKYYNSPINNSEKIKMNLSLDDRPIITALANLTWDTATLGKDKVFKSMLDWLLKTIDFLNDNKQAQLVIRCHPAEGHAPDYMVSAELASDVIKKQWPILPENVRVIKGEEEISSHSLAEMSHATITYTSTMGIEMSMNGRSVIVCGQAHYREKGFTTDIFSQEQYREIIENIKDFPKNISEDKVLLAKKYAHLVIRRAPIHIPEFNYTGRHYFDVFPERLLSDSRNYWDNLCDNIVETGLFLDTSEFCDPWTTGGD